MEMFGKKGHFCITVEDIQQALKLSLKVGSLLDSLKVEGKCINYKIPFQVIDSPSLINIMINPQADRKEQQFNWLTESKL